MLAGAADMWYQWEQKPIFLVSSVWIVLKPRLIVGYDVLLEHR